MTNTDPIICEDCGEPRATCLCPRTAIEGQEALFTPPESEPEAARPEWA